MDDRKQLFAALAKARAAITGVARDGRNSQQGYNYASAEAMMAVAGPAMAENGLSLFPVVYSPDFDVMLLRVEYLLAHESGESVAITSSTPMVVTKFKSGAETPPDKSLGAAKTYDLRYMLRGLLNIPQVEKDADVDQRDDTNHAARRQPRQNRQDPPRQSEEEAPIGAVWASLKTAVDLSGGKDALLEAIGWGPMDWPQSDGEASECLALARDAHRKRSPKQSKEAARSSEPGSPRPPPKDEPPPEKPTEPPALRVVPEATPTQQPGPDANRDQGAAQRGAANGNKSATERGNDPQAGQMFGGISHAALSKLIAAHRFSPKAFVEATECALGRRVELGQLGKLTQQERNTLAASIDPKAIAGGAS